MSAETIAALAGEYERLGGARLAEDRHAARPAMPTIWRRAAGRPLPFAWALGQLAASVGNPGWSCMAKTPTVAARPARGVP